MTSYRVTVRYGSRYQRYHTFDVEGGDVAEAMRRAAEEVPAEILPEADLVELRVAIPADERSYLEGS